MKMRWFYLAGLGIVLLALGLRGIQLDRVPPALYWEEVALGYDAYSILKTGKDHHGNPWPIVAFESYGDWKPSLYFYALVPSLSLFGLTPFAVRLPSFLAGVGTIGVLGLLVLQLFLRQRRAPSSLIFCISLFSMGMLALMPWHILVSRVGFETNLGLLCITLGGWLLLNGIEKNAAWGWLGLSALSFGLSLYAYHGNRVFVPLLGLSWGVWFWKPLWQKKGQAIAGLVIFLLVTLPILYKAKSVEVQHRFAQTSAFTSLEPILASNQAIQSDGGGVWARLGHHRWLYYADIFWDHYTAHFGPNFLLIEGDKNPRHSVGLVGQLYWIMGLLVILGIGTGVRRRQWELVPVLIWLLLAPIPASITDAAPHALRALPMVIPLSIFMAYGGWIGWELGKRWLGPIGKWGVLAVLLGALVLETSRFVHYYWSFYPTKSQREWQYGYKELMEYVASVQDDYEQIVITRSYGRPAMYYWFFNQTDPILVQAWDQRSSQDQGEYLQFDHLYFGAAPDSAHFLEITQIPKEGIEAKHRIFDLLNQPVFYIYESQPTR